MAQNTNLNVTPYYDDFDKAKNFYRVLYRPGYPIQARELTTMQSILQNQVESVGSHLFKDGAMVIPGQVGYDLNVNAIMLQESFLGANVEDYRSQLDNKIITGLTSGVKAKVLYSIPAAESERGYITIYVKYIESGGEQNSQNTFTNNEQLVTDTEITFGTTLIEVGSPFAQLLPTDALQTGSVAYVQEGVYFIRGFFVDVPYQYILLDQYGTNPKYRVGLEILESIITPEDDLSLNDNAAGTSNYAAPGAHRFKISTNLTKKLLSDDADKDFIELLRINGNKIEKLVDRSAYDEIEKTMALRTYEESGNYVVNDFQITMRENLDDGFNNGVYTQGETTAQGNGASSAMYAVEFSPGVAYVRGYRIKNLSPVYLDLDKPRSTDAAQNVIIPFEMGNFSNINNIFGFPNCSGATISNHYQTVELYDNAIATPGDISGNLIGYARVKSCEFTSNPDGTFGNADDIYKLHLSDVQMVTILMLNSDVDVQQGSIIVGVNSGARAYVISSVSSSNDIPVYQVEGTFQTGEMVTVDGLNLDTITHFHTYVYSDTRSFAARDEITQAVEFTADLMLENIKLVQGASFTYDATGGSETITGLNSNFAADLRPGDKIYFSDTAFVTVDLVDPTNLGASRVGTIFNYQTQVVNVTPGAVAPVAGTYTALLRYRGKLFGLENADLMSRMPRPYVKSISDESMTVRRTFDSQTVASNSISITLPENEQFAALSDNHFTFTVMASSNGSYPVGSQIPIDDTNTGAFGYTSFTSAERTTLQIDNLTNITTVKVTGTVSKNFTTRKTKSPSRMFILKVNKTQSNLDKQNYGLTHSFLYGTRIEDKEISLGLIDAYNIHAVYESLDDADPVIPSVTLVEPSFFATGSVVIGKTSGARARVVDFNSSTLKLTIVYLSGQLVPGEIVNGFDSSNNAISGIINDSDGSVVIGSKVVTDRYQLRDGQTNFLYTTSALVRQKGVATPIRKLKVVLDYYNHSATGDYFGGQSYLDTDYEDVPFYGEAFLADFLDFRPGCKNLYSGSGTVASPAFVNCSTFDFKSRVFPTSSTPAATLIDIPKLNSDFRCDFDWYLPRIDKLFLLPNGEFQVVKGKSEEIPNPPDDIAEGMQLALLRHRPYGFDPEDDVIIVKSDNRRYTMRDIGSIEKRLDQVEYYTAINMLEADTINFQITDAAGKNRFKNGFLVDDFTDHAKSAVGLEDYGVALDYVEGTCRPSHYTTNVPLVLNESLSANYQKTGPLITLPYQEELLVDQPYASRVENVNPFNVFAYIGRIDLTPASDDWVDTNRLPTRVTNMEGDFRATQERLNVDQNGFAPIQWNAWRTNWSSTSGPVAGGSWREHTFANFRPGRGRRVMQNVTTSTTTSLSRTGIRTRVVPRIDRQSLGDSVLSSTAIPWIRSRNVDVNIVRMKPRTSFFAFFDGQKIDDFLVPKVIELIKDPSTDSRTNSTPFVIGETVTGLTSGCKFRVAAPDDYFKFNPYDDAAMPTSYSSTTAFLNIDTISLAEQAQGSFFGNVQVGEILEGESGATAVVQNRRIVTDRLGQYRGSFAIPDPGVDTNPRWNTGTRVIRFTTNEDDSRLPGAVASAAQAEYAAAGTLNTVQENVLAIRNADIVRDTVSQDRTVSSTRTESRQVGWWDPLAQSFLVDEEGGVFLTSVSVFFNAKDENIPISMQIRTMENGYPTTTILPFSDVTINPADVQISETGSVATTFVFQAPVYIPQSIEHCFVLFSDSNSYQVWISRMGELDISGDRTISEQPYAGVLFKSQNATTWTADQYEDLKFQINRAVFDNTKTSVITLNNAPLDRGNKGKVNLGIDAVQTFQPELQLVMNSTLAFTIGARIKQETTLAQATVVGVEDTVGGTVLTVNDISGNWAAGSNTGGVILNRVVSSKTLATMTVTAPSADFAVGETISGNSASAPSAEVITWDANTNTLTLRYISTEFNPGTETITGGDSNTTATVATITYSGDTTPSSSAVDDAYVSTTPTYTASNRKVRIFHYNHAMNDTDNNVVIEGVESEVSPTFLTSSISDTDTTIQVNDGSAFHTIINGAAVSASNLGFLKIHKEIMSYSGITNNGKTITINERGIDGTTAVSHADETMVHCYNLDGIPLPEINKTHEAILTPTIDSYDVATSSLGRLGIKSGGGNIVATQNIQYEVMSPNIQRLLLPKTNVTGRVNTITGTSINDSTNLSQNSFSNTGEFYDILLNNDNYFNSPQLICSQINESSELSGAKSLRMDLNLLSDVTNVSPIIDTDRLSVTLVSNRINNPSNPNSALLPAGDDHTAAYITKVATLTNPSSSIKLIFAGYRPPNTFIKPLYRVVPTGSTESIDTIGYEFFPTSDATIPATTENELYQDYEYEVNGLDFTAFQIKLVFVSPNQAFVPIIKDFRAIALAV